MKQNIFIGLSLALFCIAHSYSMEENSHKRKGYPGDPQIAEPKLKKNRLPDSPYENYDEKNFEFFQSLPPELRHKIIATILEENINKWDDIFNFDKNSLKEVLDQITLVSKDFLVFEKEELKNFIRNLKQDRFAYLQEIIKDRYKDISKEELNKRLTDLLKFDMPQNDLEESVRLIIAGADIDIQDNDSCTALIHVARKGDTQIAKLLIDAGADINTQSNTRWTALMRATLFGHIEIVRLLIDARADINLQDNGGQTALIKATYEGHIEIVRLLIDAGANINIKDKGGWTALIRATHRGHLEIVKLLIDTGADINIKDKGGKTALIMAALRGHTEIVRLLINADAGINIKDNDGCTALIYAARFGHTEIVKLLSKQD